jgi:thiamine-phosphate pyrophosphorylase
MLVTDRRAVRGRELVEVVAAAARGGVGVVQVRERDLSVADLRLLVERIRERVPASTLVTVNSRADVARIAGVGLHLPASHAAVGRGKWALLGRSVHDLDETRRALREAVDYLIAGPVYPTASKPDHPGSGPGLVRGIARAAHPVPVFAIGGIEVSRVPEVVHAGAHGVAVCGAILAANDPQRVAEALSLALAVASGVDAERVPRVGA